MENLKRKFSNTCPDCNSEVELYQINFNSAIEICNNLTCTFPFDRPCAEGLIHEFPSSDTRYSKKLKTRSSSIANTVAASKASENDENSVKSAKETSSDTLENSSLIKQKDQLHSKEPSFPLLQGDQEDQDLISIFIQESQQEDALTTQPVENNVMQSESSESDGLDPVITNLLNFYSDITQKPSPNQTVQLSENIALPPATAANTSPNSAFNVPSLSLEAIESLLNDTNTDTIPINETTDCTSPSSYIATPKDPSVLSWMEDLDTLFGADMAQSKFNPLQGGDEFDSFLGF
ncbi:hypothetical protein BD770DRAFT_442943 [Pilaira anomala]|nr:hypothetical protein BD770DRAFT_442943 [Pilaira anomala]